MRGLTGECKYSESKGNNNEITVIINQDRGLPPVIVNLEIEE
jgi:hypothetical protein